MASTDRTSRSGFKKNQSLTNDNAITFHKLSVTDKGRKEKILSGKKYQSRTYKTQNSNWTPRVHKASNEQIFKERKELVLNWFDLWSDSQRKRFLDAVFSKCSRSQLLFTQNWFTDRVPLRHLDFTRLLPRCLSLYIFNFLDPRSLSRASMVCWHWKFLAEQEALWMRKAMKHGWFLPYTPEDHEYGAWKRYYIACFRTLDLDALSHKSSSTCGSIGDGSERLKQMFSQKIKKLLQEKVLQETLERRPPWRPNDWKPRDLDLAREALLREFNPNDPAVPPALLLHHNKFGIIKQSSLTSDPRRLADYGLLSKSRRDNHRINKSLEDGEFQFEAGTRPLSQSLQLESFEEKRIMEIMHMSHDPPSPTKATFPKRPNLSGGSGVYPIPWAQTTSGSSSKIYPWEANPRIIFISSRVPSADLLVDAVLFGVIPIVYEYEGTTLEYLMHKLDLCLQGRSSKSIGVFCHGERPCEIRLVHGTTVNYDNLDNPDIVRFFETIANHVLLPDDGGHIDIFLPLASHERGLEMLAQLNVLTDMEFTSPMGVAGNYNYVNSEWLSSPEPGSPCGLYFCTDKLNTWANTADQVQEACQVTKQLIGTYFEQKHKDVVSQLVGQIVFDATCQVDIQGTRDIAMHLTDGLLTLATEHSGTDPLEYLGRYLLDRAGADYQMQPEEHKTLTLNGTMPASTLSEQLTLSQRYDDSEGTEQSDDGLTTQKKQKERSNKNMLEDNYSFDGFEDPESVKEDIEEDLHDVVEKDDDGEGSARMKLDGEDLDSEEPPDNIGVGFREKSEHDSEEESPRIDVGTRDDQSRPDNIGVGVHQEKEEREHDSVEESPRIDVGTRDDQSRPKSRDQKTKQRVKYDLPAPQQSMTPRNFSGRTDDGTSGIRTCDSIKPYQESRASNIPGRLTAEVLKNHPDRRSIIAKEIVASEVAYTKTLEIIKNKFQLPLQAALSSNRAIISHHNVQMLFSDSSILLQRSRELLEDLKNRLMDWGPHQCLGDVFINFTGKLKAYINFINNYPGILTTLDKCCEQSPLFRAFLKRHERTIESKMLTLAELFLVPTRRIKDYVTWLTWFQTHTPTDHADRDDLADSIRIFSDLDKLISESKKRVENEKELVSIQKRIIKCPALCEANRFFLKHLDVAHLKPQLDSVPAKLRLYQHIETIGLWLFNDALVVTQRTTNRLPFERCTKYNYKFESCVSLSRRLKVEDIADSKYIKNAFVMSTGRREWICAAETADDRFNWISILEQTVMAALDEQ